MFQDEACDVVIDMDSMRIGSDAGLATHRNDALFERAATHAASRRHEPADAPHSIILGLGRAMLRRVYAPRQGPPTHRPFRAPCDPPCPAARASAAPRRTLRRAAASTQKAPATTRHRTPRSLITRAAIHHRHSFPTVRFHLFSLCVCRSFQFSLTLLVRYRSCCNI